jgi:tetratricopeptide (TPR) repeat protein
MLKELGDLTGRDPENGVEIVTVLELLLTRLAFMRSNGGAVFPKRGTHRVFHVLLLAMVLCAGAVPAAHAQEDQEPPPAAPPAAEDPNSQNRARVLQADLDGANRVTAIKELVQAGDLAWLKTRILEENPEEQSFLSVFSGFLLLSRIAEKAEVKERCRGVLTELLEDPETRPKFVQRLKSICLSSDIEPDLLKAAVDFLAVSCDLSAVDILIAVLESGDAEVKKSARASLVLLTYQDFALDAAKWKEWWGRHRRLSRDRLIEESVLKNLQGKVSVLSKENLELVKAVIALDPKRAFEFLGKDDVRIKRFAAGFLLENALNPEIAKRLDMAVAHLDQGEYDKQTRTMLLSLLGQVTGDSDGVPQALIRHLQDQDPEIAGISAESLKALIEKKLLKDEDYIAVTEAVQRRLAGATAPETGQGGFKVELIGLLKECGLSGAAVDSALLRQYAAAGQEPAVRQSAIRALGVAGDPEVLQYLKKILDTDTDGAIRFEAANALQLLGKSGKVEQGPVIAALAGGLKDLQANVRSVCVHGLGIFKTQDVVDILLKHLESETDPKVCSDCIDTLGTYKNSVGLHAVVRAYAILKARDLEPDAMEPCAEASRKALRKISEETPELYYKAGEEYFAARCYAMAAWSYDEFLKTARPANGEQGVIAGARGKLAQSLYLGGSIAEALPLLEEIEKQQGPEPSRRERHRILAAGYLALGEFAKSAAWFDKYMALIPEAEAAALEQAQRDAWSAHFGAGAFDRALELASVLKVRDPGNNLYLYRFALSLTRAKRIGEAEKEFRRLLNGRLGADEVTVEWSVRYELAGLLMTKRDLAGAKEMIGLPGDPLPEGAARDILQRVGARRKRIQEELAKQPPAEKPAPVEPEPADEAGEKPASGGEDEAAKKPDGKPADDPPETPPKTPPKTPPDPDPEPEPEPPADSDPPESESGSPADSGTPEQD